VTGHELGGQGSVPTGALEIFLFTALRAMQPLIQQAMLEVQ